MSRIILAKTKYINFINNIKLLVDKYGGVSSVAKEIGASYNTVYQWCRGDNLPDGKSLLIIHEKYGVSLDWLMYGEGLTYQENMICEPKTKYQPVEDSMAEWPEEIRSACRQLKDILLSDHPVIKPALLSNLAAFQHSVEKEESQDDEIKKLSRRLQELENRHKAKRSTGTDEAASSSIGKRKT